MEDIVNGNLWGRFTDNFMHLTVTENFDWYNDANWADILDKVRAVARIGAAGGAKGIMFDPEGHSSTCYLVDEVTYCEMPWTYADQPIADTCGDCYAAVQAKVHARGIEFIDAIEEYMPNHTLLTLFWTTYRRDRNFDVQGDPYGLLNSFMLGVLEGAGAGTKIVDGDELSYYPSLHAYAAGHTCLANATTNGLIPSSLQAKYLDKVSLAHAVWDWDEHIGTAEVMGNERIYPAMLDSSHYVWFYTQNTETQPREYLNHIGIRPGFIEAINRGKAWAIEEANW
jgi:hypothetical protein